MTDHETGRVIQAIEDMGELDNTLIFYIAGDNGTSAEGLMNGLYNEMTYFNNEPKGSDIDFMLKHYDDWGTRPRTRTCRPAGPSASTRRSPGPSKSPPTMAARATRW